MAETVTIPRDLFEMLVEDAIDLRGEHDWHKDEPRCGYQKAYEELSARIDQAIAIRDNAK